MGGGNYGNPRMISFGSMTCLMNLHIRCNFHFRHFKFQNFKFFLDISQRNSKFQFLVFNFQYSHIQIQTFQFSNSTHKDFNFQFSTLNIHTSQFKHFSFQNFKFQTFHIFKFQLLVFTHWNSNILIFKILDSKHSIYCSTLVGLAHASQTIN